VLVVQGRPATIAVDWFQGEPVIVQTSPCTIEAVSTWPGNPVPATESSVAALVDQWHEWAQRQPRPLPTVSRFFAGVPSLRGVA
jgi:hypothetical protein